MLNIVEKYSADTAVESEAGVIGIEYVLLAAIVAVAIGLLAGPLNGLAGDLQGIIDGIVG
jgi:Flp pilus assembly pilin Flp